MLTICWRVVIFALNAKILLLQTRIKATREKVARFNRVIAGNKFSLSVDSADKPDEPTDDEATGGITYLDSVFDHLEKSKVSPEIINKLADYVKYEQYDTESLDLDLKLNGEHCNISRHVQDKDCIECIRNMFNKSSRMLSCIIHKCMFIFSFVSLYSVRWCF